MSIDLTWQQDLCLLDTDSTTAFGSTPQESREFIKKTIHTQIYIDIYIYIYVAIINTSDSTLS